MEITLVQMLAAREDRVLRQKRMVEEYGLPIVSFSLNIPGPIKDSPLIRRAFHEGCQILEYRLGTKAVKQRCCIEASTGCEAVYAVDMDPLYLKSITAAIEDASSLGRLFDMDVLDTDLNKLDREIVGGKSRDCIVCGTPGRGCASRRVHTIEQLQQAVKEILYTYFRDADARRIGNWAVQSLLDEVCTTPKPGLVDRYDSGSHNDMDIFTFMSSAAALGNYFIRCVKLGMETAEQAPDAAFAALREAGLCAEREMYRATSGVNTHKGAIFSLGILCGAAGRLWDPTEDLKEEKLFAAAGTLASCALKADFGRQNADTVGMRLYISDGIRGIRGEAAAGFPSVSEIALPTYRKARSSGKNQNDAGVITLLHLIAHIEDTNMIARGGLKTAAEATEKVREMLSENFDRQQISELNHWFMERNLSPGGCADLLAAAYFVDSITSWERMGYTL